jgi:hypothetical protein
MPKYSEEKKQYIYKWRHDHKDELTEYNREYQRTNYWKYKDNIKKRTLNRYYYLKEVREFMNILIDYHVS